MGLKDHGLTAQEGILLHLLDFNKFRDDDILPESVTQQGIARVLDTERSYISFVLSQMLKRRLIFFKLSRIEGGKRKKKVYFLDDEGLSTSKEIRTLLSKENISCRKGGKEFQGDLEEVSKSTGLSLATLTVITDPERIMDIDEWFKERTSINNRYKRPQGPPFPENFTGRVEEISAICSWIGSSSRLAQVTGIAGTGKTSLVGMAIEKCQKPDLSFVYLCVGSKGDESTLINDLAIKMDLIGRSSLSNLLKEKGSIDMTELESNLEQESLRSPFLLILDDVHNITRIKKENQILDILLKIANENLKVLLISRESIDLDPRSVLGPNPPIHLELTGLGKNDVMALFEIAGMDFKDDLFELTAGHPLYVNLLVYYTCNERPLEASRSIRAFIRKEVLECLNRTERDMLDILSLLRSPISRERLFDMDAGDLMISESGLQSLMGSGILQGDERELSVHQLIGDIIVELMPRIRTNQIQRMISEHYREQIDLEPGPDMSIPERLKFLREYMHHLWSCGSLSERICALSELGEEMMSRSQTNDLEMYTNDILGRIELSYEIDAMDPSLITRIMIFNGWCLSVKGDWEGALKIYNKAREEAERIGDRDLEGRCLNAIGTIHLRKGEPEKALYLISNSIEMMEDKCNLCKARSNLAVVHWMIGNLGNALEEVDRSMDMAMFLDDAMGVSRGLINKGIILAQMNDLEGSRSAYEKALVICEREVFSHTLSIVHDNLGEIHRENGDNDRSRIHFQKSLELARELGFKWQIAEASRNLASLESEGPGRTGLFMNAIGIFRSLGDLQEVDRTEKMMKGILSVKNNLEKRGG